MKHKAHNQQPAFSVDSNAYIKAVRHSKSSHWLGFIFTIMFVSLRLISKNIPEGDEQTFKNIKTVKGYTLRCRGWCCEIFHVSRCRKKSFFLNIKTSTCNACNTTHDRNDNKNHKFCVVRI